MLGHRFGRFALASALTRFAVILLAAVFVACSEEVTPSRTLTGPGEEPKGTVGAYTGILEARDLFRTGGRLVWLRGWQTDLFADLVGAEVTIDGVMDADPENGLTIAEFQIRAHAGLPVLDGVLAEMEEGYLVHTRSGPGLLGAVPDPLAQHVGRRVWVAHDGMRAIRFGLLERVD